MSSIEILLAVAAVVVLVAAASAVVLVRRRVHRGRADPFRPSAPPDEALSPVAESVDRVLDRAPEPAAVAPPEAPPSLRERLGKARAAFGGSLASLLERSAVSEDTWDELSEALIRADVGVSAAFDLADAARARLRDSDDAPTPDAAVAALREEMRLRLAGDRRLVLRSDGGRPSVWLFVGVNGVGKTTTIGKLAKQRIDEGAVVVLAAGDTFRAAASEQLTTWAQRAGAEIVQGAAGADPASVVFDAVESAAARGAELVMADTAGRLHTERNLMDELRKVRRVANKGAGVVTETLLVLDATVGQNGLAQARQFTQAVEVTGVVLTKLDGSAKGGIVLAVQSELGIPVKLVGVGEGIADLVTFDEAEFIEALFS